MQKLIAEYQNDWKDYHPVVRATLLLNFELMKSGYTPIIIKKDDRARYYDVLDLAHTTMNYEPFIELVSNLVVESEKLWLSVL